MKVLTLIRQIKIAYVLSQRGKLLIEDLHQDRLSGLVYTNVDLHYFEI